MTVNTLRSALITLYHQSKTSVMTKAVQQLITHQWIHQFFNKTEQESEWVTLNDIHRYEMIYIYHHLKVGTRLALVLLHKSEGYAKMAVFYKDFRLGNIMVYSNVENGCGLMSATIQEITKAQFMPIQSLKLSVSLL